MGVYEGMVRMNVGLEDPDDLIEDLASRLAAVPAATEATDRRVDTLEISVQDLAERLAKTERSGVDSAALTDLDLDAPAARVHRVLQQLLDHTGRPLDHLARRDLGHHLRG